MVGRGIDGAAIITDPYPDNDRGEWIVVPLTREKRRGGLVIYSAEIFADQASKDAGGRPFLINSWKSQIRAITPEGEHQRIQTDAQGRLLHASREAVAPEDIEDFLLLDSTIEWQRTIGQFLPPFMFPTYDGVLEGLDPQWLRERYSLPGQVEANIDLYLRGVEIRKLSGDHRGTTVDAQVGAEANNGYWSDPSGTGTSFATDSSLFTGDGGISNQDIMNSFARFTGFSGLSGVTINVSTYSLWGRFIDLGTPLTNISANDAETPTAPTDITTAEAKVLTTAVVTWDSPGLSVSAFTASPSINTVMQELVDSHDPGEIQIIHEDDGGGNNNLVRASGYGVDTAEAPKIHLEFAGAAGIVVLRRRREGA